MSDKFGVPQKALHLHLEEAKKSPKHTGVPYGVMEKFDGWFVYIDCIDGVWQGWRSKTGRLLPSLAKYSRRINESAVKPNRDIRLIAEATINGMVFAELNGQLNQKKRELDNVIFKCHDLLMEDFPMVFSARYTSLTQLLNKLPYYCMLEQVRVIKETPFKSDWLEIYHRIIARGGEGVILKMLSATYQPKKRDYTLMKIKCEVTLDLLVIGLREGEGKYNGTLGKLVVQSKDGNINEVSGMTDEQRYAWWGNGKLIVGQVVEVQAMKILDNGSLREGRFKAVRHDKSMEDID